MYIQTDEDQQNLENINMALAMLESRHSFNGIKWIIISEYIIIQGMIIKALGDRDPTNILKSKAPLKKNISLSFALIWKVNS